MIKEHLLNNPLIGFVVSEEKKFIYMKIARTGGTSIHRFRIEKKISDIFNLKDNYERTKEWLEDLDDEKLKDYFIFTFVRNPWDRLVSVYFYFKKQELIGQEISFENFIKNNMFEDSTPPRPELDESNSLKAHSLPQYLYVEDEGKKFVNFIGRFESLEKDWKIVAKKIGINDELPHENKTNHEHYTKYYNEEMKNIVAKKYKRDIELFGYKF